MPKDLRGVPIEELVDGVQALSSVASQAQTQSIAALAARCTIDVCGALTEVSHGVFTAKKQMVERMDALTKTMADASEETSRQTQALVRWTRVLVVCTGAYTLITGGLLIVAIVKT